MTDITQYENAGIQVLAYVILFGLMYLGQRAIVFFKIKITAGQVAALDDAAAKAVSLGVTKSESVIAEKGWNHIDSKNTVIANALASITEFPKALQGMGLDPTKAADQKTLIDVFQRVLPDVFTRMMPSPATPAPTETDKAATAAPLPSVFVLPPTASASAPVPPLVSATGAVVTGGTLGLGT